MPGLYSALSASSGPTRVARSRMQARPKRHREEHHHHTGERERVPRADAEQHLLQELGQRERASASGDDAHHGEPQSLPYHHAEQPTP